MNSSSKSHLVVTIFTTIIIILACICSKSIEARSIFQDGDEGDNGNVNHDIITIKAPTYSQTLNKYQKLVILFYTESCPMSTAFQPVYTRLNELLTQISLSNQIQLAKINVDVERHLGGLNNITRVPTIRFYYNGRPLTSYVKKRGDKAEDLLAWLTKWNDQINNNIALAKKNNGLGEIPLSLQDEVQDFALGTAILVGMILFTLLILIWTACCFFNRHGGGGVGGCFKSSYTPI